MSLDNTSHPGRPGSDELVPSRYALRVGEIDVLVVSDGVLPIPAPVLATNADPAVLTAWLDDMFLPPDMLEWPLNVVVVRSGGRTMLIDAGLGVEFPDFPRAGRLGLRLMGHVGVLSNAAVVVNRDAHRETPVHLTCDLKSMQAAIRKHSLGKTERWRFASRPLGEPTTVVGWCFPGDFAKRGCK